MRINPIDAYSVFEIANKNNRNNTKNNYYPTPKTTFTFEGDTVSFSQTEKKQENKLTKTLKSIFTPLQPDVSYYDSLYKY